MQLDSLIPRDLITLLYVAVATSLGWIGGWITRRKREPVELAKLHADTAKSNAEARQINVETDVSLIQAATTALTKAERLQQERDHWERKATDLLLDLEDSRNANQDKDIRLRLHEYQMKRLKGLLDVHGISYSEVDRPRASD